MTTQPDPVRARHDSLLRQTIAHNVGMTRDPRNVMGLHADAAVNAWWAHRLLTALTEAAPNMVPALLADISEELEMGYAFDAAREDAGAIGIDADALTASIEARFAQIAREAKPCNCHPSPFEHEDECPRSWLATVPPPHFDRGATFHDGVTYNHHRDYTDRDGTRGRCTGREDETPRWVRSSAEMGVEIAVLVERHGPLTLVPDPFFDAGDDELSEMVGQALRRSPSN